MWADRSLFLVRADPGADAEHTLVEVLDLGDVGQPRRGLEQDVAARRFQSSCDDRCVQRGLGHRRRDVRGGPVDEVPHRELELADRDVASRRARRNRLVEQAVAGVELDPFERLAFALDRSRSQVRRKPQHLRVGDER
jgi:hypothetical protein